VPWNPAVPPPPVTGAPDGTLLAAAAVTVWVSVTVTSACGFDGAAAGVPDGDVLPDGDGLPDDPEASDEAELPETELPEDAEAVPVGEVVTVGEMIVGDVELDEVQAETATGASSVRAPQHSAVSLAPNGVPAVVPRTFMDPPPAPGR
jgi:hypothetical protein